MNKLIIDASNIRAGGGVTHLVELLNNSTRENLCFDIVEVYSNSVTLSKINDTPWIVKHTHKLLQKSTIHIQLWKWFVFNKILKQQTPNTLLFNPAGTYTGKFTPHVEMSQNMLIWDKTESNRYSPFSFLRIKLGLLSGTQKKAFNNAQGLVFISKYAKNTILQQLKNNKKTSTIIHHGVNQKFSNKVKEQKNIFDYKTTPLKLLYISTIDEYKHQIPLIRAVKKLHTEGFNIELHLVGGSNKNALKKFNNILQSDLSFKKIINYHGKVPYESVEKFYKTSDAFIFASSCENMPNILIEAMSSGLPILSSNFQPMPEFLGEEHPFYFDPTNEGSVYDNLKIFLENPVKRQESAISAKTKSKQYTWEKCSEQTFEYLLKTLKN